MLRVHVQSELPCDADRAWEQVQTSALLLHVARPLVTFRPADGQPFPPRWQAGLTVRVRMYLLGLVPLGTHTVHFESIDPRAREIMTREHDRLVSRWDHCIRIQPLETGRCRYSDTVDIEAGLLTPLVWLFARCFYAHRQWRWLGVARRTHSETLISD